MKTKIRESQFNCAVELKQLPSKQIYLLYIKKRSKNFLIPVKILPPPEAATAPLMSLAQLPEDTNDYIYDIHVTQNIKKLEQVYLNTVANYELVEQEIQSAIN